MTATIGHNSGVAANRLKEIVDQLVDLEIEKAAVADHIRDVYAKAKGEGFAVRPLRAVIRSKRLDVGQLAKRREDQENLDLYAGALGIEAFL